MNYKTIGKILSYLFFMEAFFLIPPLCISIYHHELMSIEGILATICTLLIVAGILYFCCRKAANQFYAREGFVIVVAGWVGIALFGALPFVISKEIPSFIDAFFEIVSGITTTGASIIKNVESIDMGLLYWRSFTHWLGGMGILIFILAIISNDHGSGSALHLLRAESPGPSVGRLVPKVRQTAKILYTIYIVLTILCVLFLLAGGMPLFDSLCTAYATAGTGGFGVRPDSMASYRPYLQTVITVFMILFGVNFSIYYMLLLRDFKGILQNEEFRIYLGLILVSTTIIAFNISPQFQSIGQAAHHSIFTVSSVLTTTGFSTINFDAWPQLSRSILVVLMILGPSAGSTGGGIKIGRAIIIFKHMINESLKILHPRTVKVVKLNGKPLNSRVIQGATIYMTAYIIIAVVSFLLISIDNFSFETNVTAVISCMNNIGHGLGMIGPQGNFSAFSNFSKLVLSLDMLLGRLEIFPILILFDLRTWSKNS